MERHEELITVPAFNRIPFLYHGFGTLAWAEEDFRRVKAWREFRILYLHQVHSDIVRFIVNNPESDRAGEEWQGDALVTTLPRLFLVIKSADCLPVLLVDEKRRAIAAVHCGWRGTLLGVLRKAVSVMKGRFGSSPQDILASLGPAIGARCYEVGEDVRQLFLARAFPAFLFRKVPGHPGKYCFDLRGANRLQLREEGMLDKKIFSVDICTHCDPRFPSFRRDREKTGRMLSFIGLVDPGRERPPRPERARLLE